MREGKRKQKKGEVSKERKGQKTKGREWKEGRKGK